MLPICKLPGGHKMILLIPTPAWLLSLSGKVLQADKGNIHVLMLSLMHVHLAVRGHMEKCLAVFVLESMKLSIYNYTDSW